MIRLLDFLITLAYWISEQAIGAACRLGSRRNALAMRRWEALHHDDEVLRDR